ncbi:MAG: hypothetical protein ACTSPI_11895 [Candidatus Heimdallarchaeaceae archaeon]
MNEAELKELHKKFEQYKKKIGSEIMNLKETICPCGNKIGYPNKKGKCLSCLLSTESGQGFEECNQ